MKMVLVLLGVVALSVAGFAIYALTLDAPQVAVEKVVADEKMSD